MSRSSTTWRLRGVSEKDDCPKKICLLAPDLKTAFGHWEHNAEFQLRLMKCYDDVFALKQVIMTKGCETYVLDSYRVVVLYSDRGARPRSLP